MSWTDIIGAVHISTAIIINQSCGHVRQRSQILKMA